MNRLDKDYLLYAMTHAARDPRFWPSHQQALHMAAVEERFYLEKERT